MKFALSAAVAGLVAILGATGASAQPDAAASAPPAEAPAAATTPGECGAFPARPSVPDALTPQNAQATVDAVNAYLDAVDAVSRCRVLAANALNGRSNDLAAYANYHVKAARAAADGQPLTDPGPAATASECADYPALSALPPATDVPGRNAWVGQVNTAHQCRLAEVRSLREQSGALVGGDREAALSDAKATREKLAAQVEALNAAEAAKGKKKKK